MTIVKCSNQEEEYLVEDGYLVVTHARGYESPNDIGTDNFSVIYFTELNTFLIRQLILT